MGISHVKLSDSMMFIPHIQEWKQYKHNIGRLSHCIHIQ